MSDSLPTQPRWHQSLIARIIVLCVVLLLCLLASVYFFTTQYYGHIVTHMEDRANNAAEQVRSQLDRILVMNPDMEIEDVIDSLTDEFTTDVKVDPGDSGPVQPLVQPGKGGFYFERQVVELSDGTSILVMMELDFNPQTEVIRAFQKVLY